MKLYATCHKEFRSVAVEKLTPSERGSVVSYIVNEHYPKDWSLFTNLIDNVKEYELENYNPKYQRNKYFEYGTIAHIYLNPCLHDTHVGLLHSDIVFELQSVSDMIEEFDKNHDTIFFNTFFGPDIDPVTLHPLYLTAFEVKMFADYMTERLGIKINSEFILNTGWIGAMCAAPVEVFIRFGEFMERYSDEIENILNTDAWHLQTWPGKHTICGIIERMWGFYLVSLNYPMKYMRIIHDGITYQHDR
jgi:hypothetical protein